jgi:hypothetical protein
MFQLYPGRLDIRQPESEQTKHHTLLLSDIRRWSWQRRNILINNSVQ